MMHRHTGNLLESTHHNLYTTFRLSVKVYNMQIHSWNPRTDMDLHYTFYLNICEFDSECPSYNTWKTHKDTDFYPELTAMVTPWTLARWALLSMGFSRQEYWSR